MWQSTEQAMFDHIAAEADILHIHGLWEAHAHVAAAWAGSNGRPFLVSAHGMLDPWALKQKRLKKTLYALLSERPRLAKAACLRAITSAEAEQYRAFGLRNPIAVIPNGVTVPDDITADAFWSMFPSLQGKEVILFLGRLHPKKGIYPLCQAWAEMIAEFPQAHLVIAGPDCEGALEQLQRLVTNLEIGQTVTIAGPLYGRNKWSSYKAAEAFILPSFSEGFSIAVLEAMGTGTPVIISDACYFPEAIECGGGWRTPTDVTGLAAALSTVLRTPSSVRKRMGERAKDLVSSQYAWNTIAQQLASVQDWLLGGPRPDVIRLL